MSSTIKQIPPSILRGYIRKNTEKAHEIKNLGHFLAFFDMCPLYAKNQPGSRGRQSLGNRLLGPTFQSNHVGGNKNDRQAEC